MTVIPTPPGITAEQVATASKDAPVLIVLDDDPTGTQSVTKLPVITAWEEDDFRWALSLDAPAVYVMTNSRSLDPDEAERINREVARNARTVATELVLNIGFVSRSDSTLRGHFPLSHRL